MLSYVPKDSEPGVAFDGLAEMESNQLENENDKIPNIERIGLTLCDEDTVLDIIMKDVGGKEVNIIWDYEVRFNPTESYDRAIELFRSQIVDTPSVNIS